MHKNYIIGILLFFLLLVSQTIYAQQPCGTDILHQQKLASDPAYKAAFQKMNADLQKRIDEKKANDAVSKTEAIVYQIPVVVHVIETGEATGVTDNLSDYTIISAIKTLTENFRAIYSGTDIEIEFVLAKRTPDCKETTGINRIDASIFPLYVRYGIGEEGRGIDDKSLKSLSNWSNTDYYNIWVVNKIFDGIAGFGTFPGGSPELDGVVITVLAFITNNILTHEVGHGLMLYHTFHRAELDRDSNNPTDCPENSNCATQGDLICDTSPTSAPASGVCTPENCNRPISQATLENYMSYCFNKTTNFTPDQKIRMRTTLETVRKSLTTSLGATPPTFIRPISACIPTNIGLKNGIGITHFILNDLNVVSKYPNTDRKNYIDIACEQQLTLNADSEYPMKVETSTIPHNIKVYVDYNNDGDFTDKEEEVASGNTKEIEGIHTFITTYKIPNLDILFNQSLRMRVVASVTTDKIVTSCEVFNGQAEDYSIFIKKKICTIDSIRIGNQTACNPALNTYSQFLTITYPNLSFAGDLLVNGQSFAITQSPQTITLINLFADGKPVNIVARFSDDDCQFTQNDAFTAPSSCGTTTSRIVVYPNPTPNEFSYSFITEKEGNYTIRLFDAIGKLVFDENKTKEGAFLEGTINLEKQAKGLYLLQISDSKNTITTRIVKE